MKRSQSEADRLEWDADLATDYAIASVDQAKLAVLDALAGRIRATKFARHHDGKQLGFKGSECPRLRRRTL